MPGFSIFAQLPASEEEVILHKSNQQFVPDLFEYFIFSSLEELLPKLQMEAVMPAYPHHLKLERFTVSFGSPHFPALLIKRNLWRNICTRPFYLIVL